ncbi:MAG: glycerol-3-phosphate 1-O-acyltransferase PlsY [Gemmatimonadota bacterium]|nr:glycerol-3-phosphate 1-O-acyltransferase PlsY [Gemmatimonadota bacterium]
MHPLFGVLLSYLAGSVPFAYLAGKARGVDLRQHGSGNLGATNAVRVLGPRVGGLVYLGDTLKGLLPVLLLPKVVSTPSADLWAIAFGLAAVIGHVRPIFLRGKGGGKGVATAGGVFFGLAWLPTLISLLVFAATLMLTRIVSVASLAAAVALPVAMFVWAGPRAPVFIVSFAMMFFVVWTHRTNIGRLRRGEEPRFGRKVEAPAR